MSTDRTLLTDEQWLKIEPLLPKPRKSRKGGRPLLPDRPVFEGILWVLRSGARWKDLPPEYPSPTTCWRPPGARLGSARRVVEDLARLPGRT